MFYSEHILTKKGPLAKIWLAAHMHSKLTKAMVFSTNISAAVARIITPDAPMALRLTSNLLLGVVRIFSRKAKYLLSDSSDAMARMRLAYTGPSAEHAAENDANLASITLADTTDVAGLDIHSLDAAAFGDVDMASKSASTSGSSKQRFLADARDITIDDYARGISVASATAGGLFGSLGMRPDVDLLPVDEPEREASDGLSVSHQSVEEEDEEPLIFTPSQQRTPSRSSSQGDTQYPAPETIRIARETEQPLPETPLPTIVGADQDAPPGDEKVMMTPQTPPRISLGSDAGAELPAMQYETPDTGELATLRTSTPGDLPRSASVADAGEDLELLLDPELAFAEPEVGAIPTAEHVAEGPPTTAEGRGRETTSEGPRDTAETAKTSTDDAERVAVSSSAAQHSKRIGSRKRRIGPPAQIDEETELSTSFFRECLQDTSDIVRPPKRGRLFDARAAQGRDEQLDVFARPLMAGVAPELIDIWTQCFNSRQRQEAPGSPVSERRDQPVSAAGLPSERSDGDRSADIEKHDSPSQRGTPRSGSDSGEGHRALDSPERAPDDFEISPSDDGIAVHSPTRALSPSVSEAGLRDAPDTVSPVVGRLSIPESVSVAGSLPPSSPVALGDEQRVPLPQAEGDDDGMEGLATTDVTGQQHARPGLAITLLDVAKTRAQIEGVSPDVTDGREGDTGGRESSEARLTARALKMRDFLAQHREPDSSIAFSEAMRKEEGITRRTAARSFYEILNLCSKQMVTLHQTEAYGDIVARPVEPAFSSARDGPVERTVVAEQ